MDYLWAPWRMEYISRERNDSHECVFCVKWKDKKSDRKNLVLYRDEDIYVVMNLYPYTNGHLLICSNQHIDSLDGFSQKTMGRVMDLSRECMAILKVVMNPDGFNFGANLGKAGGAGIAEHIHFHVVPRWKSDTNFMPVIGQSKVIMDGLYDTYAKLKPQFDNIK
jgi:ATP adenylyltransferase|tara:strand:- start:3015 stop:3509 length:495 start_codon:yes stop_codon:yes gene_type:complete